MGWPYTLNYKIPHTCAVKPCPTESHPGMWEIPMTAIKDVRGGSCAMADGCFYEEDAASIQKIFTQNFLEHYTKSKAPFPLFFHSAWFFNRQHRQDGFFKFVDSILALPDVYFVTSQELINWVKTRCPWSPSRTLPCSGAHFRIGPSGVPVAGNTNASLNTKATFANGVHARENVPIATRGSIISTAIKKFWRQKFVLRIPPQCFDEFFCFFIREKDTKDRSLL